MKTHYYRRGQRRESKDIDIDINFACILFVKRSKNQYTVKKQIPYIEQNLISSPAQLSAPPD